MKFDVTQQHKHHVICTSFIEILSRALGFKVQCPNHQTIEQYQFCAKSRIVLFYILFRYRENNVMFICLLFRFSKTSLGIKFHSINIMLLGQVFMEILTQALGFKLRCPNNQTIEPYQFVYLPLSFELELLYSKFNVLSNSRLYNHITLYVAQCILLCTLSRENHVTCIGILSLFQTPLLE